MTSLSRPPVIKLHVIDFPKKDLKPEKDASQEELNSWRTTREEVVGALKEPGCFMAKDEKLSNCHKTLFEALKKCDRYESFDIPEATTEEGIKKFITSKWPEGNDVMRQAILGYTRTAEDLEEIVRKMVFEHYKVKLPEESTGYKFRMKKYKEEVRLGCSDQEFLAVLDLNQVNGLKMKTKDGKWFSIDVKSSTFLIMAGKPLMEWSKGNINPPEYLVTMKDEKEEKYWVGLFEYYDKGKDKKKPVGSSCPP